MIRALKKALIEILLKFNKQHWTNNNAFKILIQTNGFFNKTAWQKIISESNLIKVKSAEIQFSDSKITFLKLFSEADVSFSFGLSDHMQLCGNKPKFLYFASVGKEFLNNKSIPGNFQLGFPVGISSAAIAEYVLTLSLVLNRNLFVAFNNQSKNLWSQEQLLNKPFQPLNKLIIGVLGMGNNGKAVAKKFKEIGCKVIGCDRVTDENLHLDKWFQPEDLLKMLTEVNLVVICVPLTKETRGLIDSQKLEALGSNGYLINVSRGEVVVEKDLIKALEKKIIAGAATDVCFEEPLPANSSFWHTPNLIITPHIAGNINLFSTEIMNDFLEKTSNYFVKNV